MTRRSADTRGARERGLGDDAELPADPRAGLDRPREMRLGVRGHAARAEEGAPLGRGGEDNGIDEDALFLEAPRHGKGQEIFAHDDWNDRGPGVARAETLAGETVLEKAGVAPQLFAAL